MAAASLLRAHLPLYRIARGRDARRERSLPATPTPILKERVPSSSQCLKTVCQFTPAGRTQNETGRSDDLSSAETRRHRIDDQTKPMTSIPSKRPANLLDKITQKALTPKIQQYNLRVWLCTRRCSISSVDVWGRDMTACVRCGKMIIEHCMLLTERLVPTSPFSSKHSRRCTSGESELYW